ncbi:MAG: hypothetical protein LC804_20915 [Acidobacteria bacterium]|nr:hypothetical protein [Acidobacteriota bacterium]
MATIVDPGIAIENAYDADGRCIRQTNRFPDKPQPFIYELTYRTEAGAIVQTDTTQSDGTWSRYTFNGNRYTTTETWGRAGVEPAVFTYERDPATNAITALTVTCPDRTGRPLRHSSLVREGNEDWIKRDLLQTHCSWRARRGAGSVGPR